jgi:hypothetical protein
MKLNELRKVIREEVKAAIQEELKDILLEAVRSPKAAITETKTAPTPNPEAQKAFREQMLSQMKMNGGNLNASTNDVGTFQPTNVNTTAEGSALPSGNVGLDQIMGLMKK